MKTLVEKYCEDPEHLKLFQQERSMYAASELVTKLMDEEGVTSYELAMRLNMTKQQLDRFLNPKDFSVRKLSDVFTVLGYELVLTMKPIREGK